MIILRTRYLGCMSSSLFPRDVMTLCARQIRRSLRGLAGVADAGALLAELVIATRRQLPDHDLLVAGRRDLEGPMLHSCRCPFACLHICNYLPHIECMRLCTCSSCCSVVEIKSCALLSARIRQYASSAWLMSDVHLNYATSAQCTKVCVCVCSHRLYRQLHASLPWDFTHQQL